MSAVNRSATREAVVQTLFEVEFRDGADERDAWLARNLTELELEVTTLDRDFAGRLLAAVFDHTDEIRASIAAFAPEWPYEKIARLDRAILLTAIAELSFVAKDEDIPPAVTLNEYVEIAKNYGGDSSRRFVNGVLSSLKKDIEGVAA